MDRALDHGTSSHFAQLRQRPTCDNRQSFLKRYGRRDEELERAAALGARPVSWLTQHLQLMATQPAIPRQPTRRGFLDSRRRLDRRLGRAGDRTG